MDAIVFFLVHYRHVAYFTSPPLKLSSWLEVDTGDDNRLSAKMPDIALAIDGSPPQVSRISSFMLLTAVISIARLSLEIPSMKIAHELSLSAKGCTRYTLLFPTIISAACCNRLVTTTTPPLSVGKLRARKFDR